jgi:hypothetical protein
MPHHGTDVSSYTRGAFSPQLTMRVGEILGIWVKARPNLRAAGIPNLRNPCISTPLICQGFTEAMSSITNATLGFRRTSRYFLRWSCSSRVGRAAPLHQRMDGDRDNDDGRTH